MAELGSACACFFATLLAMAALRPVAVAVELVDKPGGRKTHRGEIPVVGGLAMFVGCIFGLGLLPSSQFISAALLSAAALVVLVGLLDDRFEISPTARLTAHLVAAVLVLATAADLSITTLGRRFGDSLVEFSSWGAAAFTCVAIVGAVSGFNLLDAGFGVRGAFFVLICIGVVLSAAAIAIHYFEVSDSVSFVLWLLSGVGMVILMRNARVLWLVVPARLRRMHSQEIEAA